VRNRALDNVSVIGLRARAETRGLNAVLDTAQEFRRRLQELKAGARWRTVANNGEGFKYVVQ
jgi:hypothetical protein